MSQRCASPPTPHPQETAATQHRPAHSPAPGAHGQCPWDPARASPRAQRVPSGVCPPCALPFSPAPHQPCRCLRFNHCPGAGKERCLLPSQGYAERRAVVTPGAAGGCCALPSTSPRHTHGHQFQPCYHVPAQPALRVGSEMGKGWHLGQGAHRSKHGVNQLVSVSALTALQAGQTRELLVQDRLHGAASLPEATPSPPAASTGPGPGGGAEFLHLCQASASLAQKISGAVGTPRGGGNPKGWVGSWCWWVPSAGGIPRGHR